MSIKQLRDTMATYMEAKKYANAVYPCFREYDAFAHAATDAAPELLLAIQRMEAVIQAACKDLKKVAFLIETNPGYVINDTLWFSDVETVADAITRVSFEIEELLPNATDDRTPSGVPAHHLVGQVPKEAK